MWKYFLVLFTAALVFFSSCRSGQVNRSTEGDSAAFENAVVVQSIGEEYEYMRKNCTGCQVMQQSLVFVNKKPYDVLDVLMPNGEKVSYYFDISSFYGKW